MGNFSRRSLLIGAGFVGGVLVTRQLSEQTFSAGIRLPASEGGPLTLNDASLLTPVNVSKHITMTSSPDEALVTQLRAELREAKAEGRPIVASAARHSMGGQSLAEKATAVTMNQEWLEIDPSNSIYTVAAGTRWSTVIRELDKVGFSPKVMQSNNDFGVASTFCVNAHGWPVPFSAAGSTVRSFKMMRHDGDMITCSRTENADQFNLAMGGYGMSGIITELELDMVPNSRLVPTFEQFPGTEFGTRFMEKLKSDKNIQMAYGRLDVTIDGFFDEVLMITYTPTEDQSDLPPASGSGFLSKAAGEIFRRQVGSDRVKSLRWFTETTIGPNVGGGGEVTRNSLINEPVITLDDGDPNRTDILHEYFVSPDRFADFVKACQDIIPSSYQELLNITLRFVDTDNESVLSYATEPRIAAVMLFSQEMSLRAEDDMRRMTSALIERVLEIGGTYYLPYRLHATNGQFLRGYDRAREFVELKRQADPDLVFTNLMWDRYMAHL